MSFQEKLITLRKEKGYSQEELGFMLGVARQTISKWELGETTPDMSKLIELSRIFNVSIDEMVNNVENSQMSYEINDGNSNDSRKRNYIRLKVVEYEYKSKRQIRGIPLIHINIGMGLKKAKGIIAVGNVATGIIAVGAIAFGVLTFGALGIGVLAFSGIALALLFAVGGIAMGTVAVGGVAVGVLAIGGVAIGVYAIGGAAVASKLALGEYASGHISIGNKCNGVVQLFTENGGIDITKVEIENIILREFPNTWELITDIFSSIGK